MRTAEFGVVIVMVVVRAAPHAARAQDQDAKQPHHPLGQPGLRQDGVVLLVMVNDEKSQNQQPGQKTACYPGSRMKVPKRPGQRRDQETTCGKQMSPTPRRRIEGIGFGCQYELFSSSHHKLIFVETRMGQLHDPWSFVVLSQGAQTRCAHSVNSPKP